MFCQNFTGDETQDLAIYTLDQPIPGMIYINNAVSVCRTYPGVMSFYPPSSYLLTECNPDTRGKYLVVQYDSHDPTQLTLCGVQVEGGKWPIADWYMA